MNTIDFSKIHPELGKGEIMFSNMKTSQFEELQYETKRQGETAYDGNGNKLSEDDWKPVFVKKEELANVSRARKTDLTELRKEWRKQFS